MIICKLKFKVFENSLVGRKEISKFATGVYVFFVINKKNKGIRNIKYIGMTSQLRYRLYGHLKLKRIERELHTNEEVKIAFFECTDRDKRMQLESFLIRKFNPILNINSGRLSYLEFEDIIKNSKII